MSTNLLDFLFPAPPLSLSRRTQVFYPGTSAGSTLALQKILKDNHTNWHVFFNEKRFHNHAAHRALAAWSLGADAETLEEGYRKDCKYEKPAVKSPERITPENFNDHLGDDKYYSAYLDFFTHYVHEKGVPSALEEFVFSRKANVGTSTSANVPPLHLQPQMLSRFLNGVLHPMIHVGYGAEFHLPGMIVEGLAQTAVHQAIPELVSDLSLFEEESFTAALFNKRIINEASQAIGSAFNNTITAFDTALDKVIPKALDTGLDEFLDKEDKKISDDDFGPSQVKGNNITLNKEDVADIDEYKINSKHALSILEHLLIDPRLTLPPSTDPDAGPSEVQREVVKKQGHIIAKYVNSWPIDFSRLSGSRKEAEREVATRIEEIVWVIGVLYGVGGWTDKQYNKGRFNADFFLMHLCTSSIFLPAFCDLLSPSSQMRLLKGYLMTVFSWAVARGRPKLDIEGLFSSDLNQRETQEAWLDILREGMSHHDEHVTKILRSLSLWAGVFGTRQARAGVPLEGSQPGTASSEPSLPEKRTEGKEDSTGAADAILGVYPGTPTRATFYQQSNVMPSVSMPGSEFLDGSLFLKAALLTLDRMNWDTKDNDEEKERKKRKGPDDRDEDFWDFKGFFRQGGGGRPIMKAKC